MDMPVELVRACGVKRSVVHIQVSPSAREDNNRFARIKREGWAEMGADISGNLETV